MSRCLIYALCILHSALCFASPRTPEEAISLAGKWASSPVRKAAQLRTGRTCQPQIVASSASFFAVNTQSGFVIVSADDRLPEVLGYSDDGLFDAQNVPLGLQDLLASYDKELTDLEVSGVTHLTSMESEEMTALANTVEPLLQSKWGQGSPYNNLAPVCSSSGAQAVTGCVATAMAQIMYYYQYPAQGSGSHSYLWVCTSEPSLSQTLSANFGATTYAWSDMLDTYSGSHTLQQDAAVATLMYHCGVSIDMGYGLSSGAFTNKVPNALKSYFGYDPNFQRIQKVMYPTDSLNAIIRAELDAGRPVLTDGYNDEGGHAFVCDGYDTKGYFHINWGWNGTSNGYYLLSALNPGKQGIGGTSRGYNKGTSFYIGIQPSSSTSQPAVPQMAADSLHTDATSLTRRGTFSVSVHRMENFGLTDFDGSYGLALYDEDETQLVQMLQTVNYTLKAGYHRTVAATMSNISIPSQIADGTYHICAVYKDANYGWMRMLCTQDEYYKTIYVSNDQITFYSNNAPAEIELTKQISFPDASHVAKEGAPLSFEIKNTGGTFRGDISARIYKGNFAKGQYELMDSVVVRRNQSLSSALQQVFDKALLVDTKYIMKLCWRANSADSWHDFTPAEYDTVHFCLYDTKPNMQLLSQINFDDNSSVKQQVEMLHCRIQNTGAPFDGVFAAYMRSGNFSHGYTDEVHVTLDSNVTSDLDIPCDFTLFDADDYTLNLRYKQNGDDDWTSLLPQANAIIPITIVPSQIPTNVKQMDSSNEDIYKCLINGQLLVIHNGHKYTVLGQIIE